MSMSRTGLVALLALTSFAPKATPSYPSTAQQAVETRSAPEQLAADTSRETPGRATVTVPAGWSIVTGKNLVLLAPPETDTHIAIVDRCRLGCLQTRSEADS
jgi:hypothetical protein